MEECSELIQAISKELRGKTDIEHLAEEIADVLISIETLKQIYNVSQSTIHDWINYKQARVLERIKGDEAYEKFKHMPDYEKGAEMTKHNIDDWILEETELTKHYAENKMEFVELLKQLKEYQQLEEQCRLIKLPCKVGDDVYCILGIPNEMPCTIDKCTFKLSDINKIGKTLFLTQIEAEAKLKELRAKKMDNKETNADRIRNMSDEELAEWINTKDMCEHCAYKSGGICNKETCADSILQWLQSEAE